MKMNCSCHVLITIVWSFFHIRWSFFAVQLRFFPRRPHCSILNGSVESWMPWFSITTFSSLPVTWKISLIFVVVLSSHYACLLRFVSFLLPIEWVLICRSVFCSFLTILLEAFAIMFRTCESVLFGRDPHLLLACFLCFWLDERISVMKDSLEMPQVRAISSSTLLSCNCLPNCQKAVSLKLSFCKECVLGACFMSMLQ